LYPPVRPRNRRESPRECMLLSMDKKPPADEAQNRFAEVIRKSQQRRMELNNRARKKQMEEVEPPPRDEEVADLREEDEPEV